MTAEIAIMNKESIALAADSAVTVRTRGRSKIFDSANKIYNLSHNQPVGIMIFNAANFMGIPWETLIKIYRNKLGKKEFSHLETYAEDFIEFIKKEKEYFPEQTQKQYVIDTVNRYFFMIAREIQKKIEIKISDNVNNKITLKEIRAVIKDAIEEKHSIWEKTLSLPTFPKSYSKILINKYKDIIDKAKSNAFEKLPINKRSSTQLSHIAANLFLKNLFSPDFSGLVIAGFGKNDLFPSFVEINVEGIINNKLKHFIVSKTKIDFQNDACIRPFAQREMVDTFMQGANPQYQKLIEKFIEDILNKYPVAIIDNINALATEEKTKIIDNLKKIGNDKLNEYKAVLNDYRDTEHIQPIVSVVASLPKDELAAMAESLVNITSFKRRISTDEETVGGPIDVAVISKGDGFIWIKRKHYFSHELNPTFLANCYGVVNYNED